MSVDLIRKAHDYEKAYTEKLKAGKQVRDVVK